MASTKRENIIAADFSSVINACEIDLHCPFKGEIVCTFFIIDIIYYHDYNEFDELNTRFINKNTYQWVENTLEVNHFSAGTIFKQQILPSKDGPRAERIKKCILTVDP